MTGNWENSGKLGESKTERESGPFESNDYIDQRFDVRQLLKKTLKKKRK